MRQNLGYWILGGALVLASCGGASNAPSEPKSAPVAAESTAEPAAVETPAASSEAPALTEAERAAACESIADWRSEIIELPPEFAPSMPKGREELRFAPGMFKPEDETYFTYAFELAFDSSTRLDVATVDAVLDAYYRGLVAAVAKSRNLELPVDQVDAQVEARADGTLRATVSMYDAFVTGKPLALLMDMTISGSCLIARASPKAYDDPVWSSLARATACLPCSSGAKAAP